MIEAFDRESYRNSILNAYASIFSFSILFGMNGEKFLTRWIFIHDYDYDSDSTEVPTDVFTFHRHAIAKKNEFCEMFSKWFERGKKSFLPTIHTLHLYIFAQLCMSFSIFLTFGIFFSSYISICTSVCIIMHLCISMSCSFFLCFASYRHIYNLFVFLISQSRFICSVRGWPVCLCAFMWNLMWKIEK